MTEHQAMVELMQRALDDGLDAAARGRLDAHLRSCAGCAHEWEGLQTLHRQLLAAPPLAARSGFTARVLARIGAEHQQEPVRSTPALPLIAAAGVLGVVTLALLLAPLAGLASFEVWAGMLSDSLALFSAAAAWLSLLLTFTRVVLEAAGDGPLVAALCVGLVLTLIWVRLVAGSEFFHRQTYDNGGVL
jgi:anti-sigma factor RsiW